MWANYLPTELSGKLLVTKLCSILCDPMNCNPLGSSVHGISQARYWSGLLCLLLPGDLPNSGIKSRSPALWADSLPTEPQGKPKNTRVGCHSLLQGIFLTQGSNPGLLHQQADSLPSEPLKKTKDRLTMMIFICQIRLEFVLFTSVQEPPIDDVCFNYLDNKFLLPLDSLVL